MIAVVKNHEQLSPNQRPTLRDIVENELSRATGQSTDPLSPHLSSESDALKQQICQALLNGVRGPILATPPNEKEAQSLVDAIETLASSGTEICEERIEQLVGLVDQMQLLSASRFTADLRASAHSPVSVDQIFATSTLLPLSDFAREFSGRPPSVSIPNDPIAVVEADMAQKYQDAVGPTMYADADDYMFTYLWPSYRPRGVEVHTELGLYSSDNLERFLERTRTPGLAYKWAHREVALIPTEWVGLERVTLDDIAGPETPPNEQVQNSWIVVSRYPDAHKTTA